MSSIEQQPQTAAANPDWLKDRRKVIGASEIAALVGVCPYMSNVDVWLKKTQGVEQADNMWMQAGRLLEPAILRWYEVETGFTVTPNSELVRHPQFDFIGCTPDGYVEHDGLVEAKNTSKYIDTIQQHHFLQLQYQLGVTGRAWGSVAYLSQGNQFTQYRFDRNDELIETLFVVATEFWNNHVITGIPPALVNPADAAKLYKRHKGGKIVEAVLENVQKARRISELQAEIKPLKAERERLKEELQIMMCDAEMLVFEGVTIATWRNNKDKDSFDEDSFKKDHPELYQKYVRPLPGPRTFLLKV